MSMRKMFMNLINLTGLIRITIYMSCLSLALIVTSDRTFAQQSVNNLKGYPIESSFWVPDGYDSLRVVCSTIIPMAVGDTEIFECKEKPYAVYLHVHSEKNVKKILFRSTGASSNKDIESNDESFEEDIEITVRDKANHELCTCVNSLKMNQKKESICPDNDLYLCSMHLRKVGDAKILTGTVFEKDSQGVEVIALMRGH